MRLFVAINLPAEERARLHVAAAPLRAAAWPVRWVAPETIHLTLKFLGEVPAAEVTAIEEVTTSVAAAFPPFELELSGFGAFPAVRRPRVFWTGIAPQPVLAALQQQLEAELDPRGYPREQRPYHAHLTLGRARDDARAADFRDVERLLASLEYRARIAVSTLDVMRSHLSRSGARYERIHAAPLLAMGAWL